MNWDQVEGKWKQMKGAAKKQWGKLTDDDITAKIVFLPSSFARSCPFGEASAHVVTRPQAGEVRCILRVYDHGEPEKGTSATINK